ncbi:MAG: NADH-quinone oxidoreductase subunit NuoK [Epsilonproteobacteria bacterium]|nr:MAG: NADH-quinone oxidoreductase subunit NuoK [Campylobacterota bacterium]
MTPDNFFLLATLLFSIGLIGVVSRRNLFVVYMSIELMLSAINLVLATFSRLHGDMHGSVMVLLIIAVIAAEAALFLAMVVHLYRLKRTVDSDDFNTLAQTKEEI